MITQEQYENALRELQFTPVTDIEVIQYYEAKRVVTQYEQQIKDK